MTGIGVHWYWVHGEVGNQQGLSVFKAAATPDLLRYSEQCCTKQEESSNGSDHSSVDLNQQNLYIRKRLINLEFNVYLLTEDPSSSDKVGGVGVVLRAPIFAHAVIQLFTLNISLL